MASASGTKQASLDSLIADLEQDENIEYRMKQDNAEEAGQIVEVYEISNLEDAEITYEDEEMSESNYELMNVVTDGKSDDMVPENTKRARKEKNPIFPDMKPRTPAKLVDEDTMGKAIHEIMSNSNR